MSKTTLLFTLFLIIHSGFAEIKRSNVIPPLWVENQQRSLTFRCKIPQPRAVDVSEMTSEYQMYLYSPKTVVLHRCEDAGCCRIGITKCSPLITEEVDLGLRIEEIGEKMFKYAVVKALNHTECHCA